MSDADLSRFITAQAAIYDQALAELRRGRKESHWMWFIFPQLAGLGRSETARFYGVHSLDEAKRYLAHPLLGTRLRACTAAMMAQAESLSAEAILGSVDALKLCSSMTLFEAAGSDAAFAQMLNAFYAGRRDPPTLHFLAES